MSTVRPATTDDEILRCFPVMAELRPHLLEGEFLARVRRQERDGGYRLACAEEAGAVKSVAGYRVLESLSWGRFLYVDDLVTQQDAQSRGHGQALFAWLLAQAAAAGCAQFHLDSGVQRFAAHRFYLGQRMDITCHHFARKLT